ncbi:hypothetical protein GW915_07135 [bacterium]|nr:hypothetical protein [bacterium]
MYFQYLKTLAPVAVAALVAITCSAQPKPGNHSQSDLERSLAPQSTKLPSIQTGPVESKSSKSRNFDFEPDHLVVFFRASVKSEKRTVLHECRIALDSHLITQEAQKRFTSIKELVEEIATGESDWSPQGRRGFSEDIKTLSMINLTELKTKKRYSIHKYDNDQGESARENEAVKKLQGIAQALCN